MGSTYDRGHTDTAVTEDAHARNAESLRLLLSAHEAASQPDAPWQGWAEVRCASLDRLPMAGAVPDVAALLAQVNQLGAHRTRLDLSQVPRLPGVYALTALGSRGLTLAHWCATHVAQSMDQAPVTAPEALWKTLDPARFVWKQSRRQASPRAAHSVQA
jgi:tRNA 5-methylaminomethyl-2-thiouridine biosynthesis bifunctional protein